MERRAISKNDESERPRKVNPGWVKGDNEELSETWKVMDIQGDLINSDKLIKWIKEEINIKSNEKLPAPEEEVGRIVCNVILSPEIQRWMKRFNLTMENLK